VTDDYLKRRLSTLASLADRVAIVTGAAQGFGYAIAERLAEAGAAVGLLDIDFAGAQRAADRIQRWAPGGKLLAVEADVTEPADVGKAFTTVEQHLGPVDILVNNAGVYSNYMFLEMPIAEFDRIQRVNVRGVFLCSQRAARAMTEHGGGVIVHIASVDALGSSAQGLIHYTTSKHGIAGLTKSMAMELGPMGIRVNAVCPGASYTEGTYALLAEGAPVGIDVDAQWEAIVGHTPLGRLIDPDEIGVAVAIVASDLFQSVHGSMIAVDGGILVQPLEGYVPARAGADG
jgi:NAD(P)-dependent dehydrogenase (short-subunit alcohol dehydrogenase family)